jgi:hypothetical protein
MRRTPIFWNYNVHNHQAWAYDGQTLEYGTCTKSVQTVQVLARRTYIHTYIHTYIVQTDGVPNTNYSYFGARGGICKPVEISISIFLTIIILSHKYYLYEKVKITRN